MLYFLDTNICIYYLNNSYPQLVNKILSTSPQNIKLPSIVQAELLYGVEKSKNKKSNQAKVDKFLSLIDILPFDKTCAKYYSNIRTKLEVKGKIIGPNDLLIAAIVLANNGTLVTNNISEFKRVPNLKVTNWI
ncbi:MAG: type II toxin-antitoxin system VapC family toxin [Melioribacteraceae bacterium]